LNISCGSYEQLEYYANNFDDFAVSYDQFISLKTIKI